MEKLQELFSGIFCPEGEGSSSVPSKIVFGGKRKKSLEYSRVTMRPIMLGGKLVYQAEYTYPKKSPTPIWSHPKRAAWHLRWLRRTSSR